jgi:drug/metabolite transporter (DMT)-like permease
MWALEPLLAKLSYRTSDFLQTSAIRALFVTLTAFLYASLTHGANLRIRKHQFPILMYIAVAGTLFADLIYFFALTRIPVINAVIIGHMQPIFIVVIGFLVLKRESLTKFDFTGIFLMIAAGLMVTTRRLENFATLQLGTSGDLLVLSATIAWATTAIAMRKYLKDMNAGVVTFYRFLIASIAFSVYLISTAGQDVLSFDVNIYQIVTGIVVGAGTILYYEGLKRIKAAQVGALELSTPFFAAVFGFLVLEESVTAMQFVGMLFLFPGIYFLSKKEQ